MSVQFRLLTNSDIPEAMRLKDAAGWNQTTDDWQRFLTSNPEGCFAAESNGHVVGTATTIVYEEKFAWIGMVLVDALHRGRGIGGALLERAIRHLDSRGIPCAKLDATPQGKPLYEKLGFVSEYQIERWVLKRPSGGAIEIPSFLGKNLDEVLALDRAIFGADRGPLLRSIAHAAPEFALINKQRAEIASYALGRHGSLADHLGPWMASNREAAANMLDQFLRRSARSVVFVDCLTQNPYALPRVKERGFEFSRPLTRMFRGENRQPGQPELLCAALGPEFG